MSESPSFAAKHAKSARQAMRRWVLRSLVSRLIRRVDTKPIPHNPGEIRLFMAARNEALRLPFILQSYLSRGVDRIFVIDNGSTDETAKIVLAHEKAHLFHTQDHYRHQLYWIDYLLRRYGCDGWDVVVDADEILIYPDFERVPLPLLCAQLDRGSYTALDAVLLDMYPEGPLRQSVYKQGDDPAQVAAWFDADTRLNAEIRKAPVELAEMSYLGPDRLVGGMRRRVFGVNPCISKFPLVRFNKQMFLWSGAHYIQGARISPMRGALLHYKYLHDFEQNVRTEVVRGVHWNNAVEYKGYLKTLEAEQELGFRCDISAKLSGSHQLVELGIMESGE